MLVKRFIQALLVFMPRVGITVNKLSTRFVLVYKSSRQALQITKITKYINTDNQCLAFDASIPSTGDL